MKNNHAKLIAKWNEDNSTEFEFAYGTGVDFTWQDCDIHHVINNPSAQIRIKARKPKKEKRWIGTCKNFVTALNYPSVDECKDAVGDDTSWEFHEIEVEV